MDENATHALMMTFGLLVLIIALSISVYMFSEVINVSEKLINFSDKTSYYETIEFSQETSTGDDQYIIPSVERYVDADTIIPTLYRYNKENFCVKIYDAQDDIQNPKLIQIFDRNIENNVHNAIIDTQAMISSTDKKAKDNYAYKTLFNDSSKPYYMFGAPWTGSPENIKKRVDYFISGTSGYIDTNYINYKDNRYHVFAKALLDSKDKNSKVKFKERFISYSYSGDTYTSEDGDELVTVDSKDKIIIIYTIIKTS